MKIKRLFSFLMALTLCLSLLPMSMPVKAATVDDLTYSIANGEVTITNCKSNASGELIIPEIIEGCPVTGIGDLAFYGCDDLASVTIPDSVTSVGFYAFASYALEEVYFGGDAPEFDFEPFYNCSYTLKLYYHRGAAGWNGLSSWLGSSARMIALDHIRSQYTYDHNHTCTADGTERSVCYYCGDTDVRVVEGSAAHRYYYVQNNDATCTADGTQTGQCMLCGVTQTVTASGSALGHDCSEFVSDDNATCTSDGTQTGQCRRCGITETVTIPGSALGHAYSDYVFDNNATCTVDGTKSKTCANCGDVVTVLAEDTAMGHSFTNYISNGNYTCMVDGTKTAKCDHCDATDMQTDIGSKAHRYFNGSCIYCGKEEEAALVSISGSLTAYGEGEVLLKLISSDGEMFDYFATGGTYQIAGVAPGDYSLLVSQDGCVTRSYELSLNEGAYSLDVKIHLYGDVNGDGRHNIVDVARIYAYVKGTFDLDHYEHGCADYNDDGFVNLGDVARVYSIVKNTK